MADYLVLARKYRSTTFDEVVGQEHIAQTLKNAIATGRVAHAFLFGGTRGVGKTTMARILAKALNCLSSDGPTPTPCNHCEACLAIARGEDVDVSEIDGASNRGIDEIRELRSNAIYRPSRSRYKIYYIDEVHMLTREAFNALLKTLEEPPAHVKFIFATTEAEKLPATILSRCQRFDFRNIPTPKIAEHLANICKAENVQAEPGAIFRIARAAAGSMRDGLSLLDQLLSASSGQVREEDVVRTLGTPGDERTSTIIQAMAENNPAAALESLEDLLNAGVTLESAVNSIAEMFRNMMLALSCGPESHLIELPDSQRKVVADLAAKFSLPVLVQAVVLCQTTSRNLRGLTSGRGLVEAAIVRLAAADKFVDAQSLLDRLEKLSGGGGRGPTPGPSTTSYSPAARTSTYGGEKKNPLTAGAGSPPAQAAAPAGAPSASQSAAAAAPSQPAASVAAATPVATASPAGPAAAVEAAGSHPPLDMAYLSANWAAILPLLSQERAVHLTGLLAPAMVMSVAGDVLTLAYGPAHESIRVRCQAMTDQIGTVLGRVFGRNVRCEFVPAQGELAEQSPSVAVQNQSAAVTLSTAERTELQKDPAVGSVMSFFDGTVTNVIRPSVEKPKEVDEPEE